MLKGDFYLLGTRLRKGMQHIREHLFASILPIKPARTYCAALRFRRAQLEKTSNRLLSNSEHHPLSVSVEYIKL